MPVVSSPGKGRGKASPLVVVLALALVGAVAYIVFSASGDGGARSGGAEGRDGRSDAQSAASASSRGGPESASATGGGVSHGGGSSESEDVAEAEVIAAEDGTRGGRSSSRSAVPPVGVPQPSEFIKGKVFDNDVENWLEMVSRDGFESEETPRVNMSQDEIVAYLKQPVDIYDEDDDETIAAKERTAEVKAQALQFIEDGGTLNQFLRDYAAQVKEGQETVRDVREEMLRIFHDEGIEAAQEYLDKANPQLREQGLKEVVIGKGTIKMMERRKAREARDAARQ